MPKTLVLFHGDDDVAAMADAVAEGARSVRFAEVDVRRLDAPDAPVGTGRHRPLGSAEELAGYDGLVLGAAASGKTALPDAITRLIADAAALRKQGGFSVSVGSAFSAGATGEEGRWSLLRVLGELGLVLVPDGGQDAEAARKQGHRLAHVVSWITHARSHHH